MCRVGSGSGMTGMGVGCSWIPRWSGPSTPMGLLVMWWGCPLLLGVPGIGGMSATGW